MSKRPKILPNGTVPNEVSVVSVVRKKLKRKTPVYDLSVPGIENFALASGHYVHNCKKARMPWQEVLPLRGKLPNPIRTETGKFMSNEEVVGIFTAVGVLPGEGYDSKKRRIGRIGFLPDADPDGKHISSELIAFVTRYLPDFLEKGKVFYINSPLFVGSHKGVKKYANTTEDVLAQFSSNEHKSVLITRMKGWAEAAAEDLKTIAMDPKTRNIVLLKSSPEDASIVSSVMGEDVAFRKEMLGIGGGK